MPILTWLYGDTANADAAAQADAQLRELNQKKYGSSGMIQDTLSGTDGVDVWVPPGEQEKQVNAAFQEGLNDGANNVTGFVSGAFNFIGKALGAVLLGIPIWVWLIAGAGVFFYLGGGVWLRRKITKA